jgi:cyclophilin family peptidyl-prolyl cis-trans isomerase
VKRLGPPPREPLLAVLALLACAVPFARAAPSAAAAEPAVHAAIPEPAPEAPAEEKVYAVFDTTVGPIAVELLTYVAPKHVAQIRRLIELGVYDGLPIFRIQRGFVAQVHDARSRPAPLAPHQLEAIEKIPAELSVLAHERGVLSMARGDDPNGAETSFSFLLGRAPHLDGHYTVFGRTLGNEPTFQAIEAAAGTDPVNPLRSIAIERARIVDEATARTVATAGADIRAAEPERAPRWTLLGLTSAVAVLALATSLVAFRTGGRGLISLALATFLCAFFVVFAVLSAELDVLGPLRPWVATLLFAASILSFKVMGRFDSTG